MDGEDFWIETNSGESIFFRKREDGDFYVETRSFASPPIVVIVPEDAMTDLANWISEQNKSESQKIEESLNRENEHFKRASKGGKVNPFEPDEE